jgi:hypothetical protein
MSSYLAKLEVLPADVIAEFRRTHQSMSIPVKIQEYLLDLEAVIEIRDSEKHNNLSRIARILVSRRPQLDYWTAMERVYDALTFFHVNDNVSNEVWNKIYADKLEDLARLCILKGDNAIAFKSIVKAHELRTKSESRIKLEDLKQPVFLITPDIRPEDLGYEKSSLMEISKKYSDGEYIKLIDKLPVSDEEKKRMYKDAGIDIEDVNPVENE